MTTRTGRFFKGISIGYVSMSVALAVGLWLTPFLISHLGQERYGIWLMIGQALMYLGLMDLGAVALVSRETSFAIGRAGSIAGAVDLSQIIGRILRLLVWQVPLVAGVAVVAWFLFLDELHAAKGPLAWLLALFVLRFPLRIFIEILIGLQDLSFVGKVQLVGFGVTTIITVSLVLSEWGLYALVVGWGAGQLIPALIGWWRVRRQFPFSLPGAIPGLSWTEARKLITKGGWVSAAQVAHLLVYGSDVLILGNILGPAAVVPYACTGKLVSVLQNQPQLIMETARPALSELRAGSERGRLREITSALTLAVLIFGGLIACVIAATNGGFTSLWVGPEMFGGALLTTAIVVNMMLRLWNASTIHAIFAFGYERRISLTTMADGLLTCGLMFALVPRFGIVAAPVASIVSILAVSLPFNLAALAKEQGVSLSRQILGLAGWFVRFALVFVAVIMAERAVKPQTVIGVALTGASVAFVYGLAMIPLIRRPPLAVHIHSLMSGVRARLARRGIDNATS